MDEKIIYHEHGKDSLYKTWHSSENNMIIFTYSDGGSIVCSEKSYPIKKGVLCFIASDKYHYTLPDPPELYDRSKIFFSDDKLEKILKAVSSDHILNYFSSKSFIYAIVNEADLEIIENIFKKINSYALDSNYSDSMFVSGTIELLVFLSKYSLENTPSTSGIMNEAIEYINSNITTNLTIDEICSKIHISKYHFCRQFKITTGTTIMKYILQTRIVLAKNMLSNESLSITEISNRCGFSSVAYFSRVFKEETGMNPLTFKKNFF